MPDCIVVQEGATNEFIAWAATYVRGIRPFTAHIRVMSPSAALLASEANITDGQGALVSAAVGMVLAEGMAHSLGKVDPARLSLSSFSRTLSFAFGQAISRYPYFITKNNSFIDHIVSGWESIRLLAGQPKFDLATNSISVIWSSLIGAVSGGGAPNLESGPRLPVAVQELLTEKKVSNWVLLSLAEPFVDASAAIESLDGPRELRVKHIYALLERLVQLPPERARDSAFLAGYLVSRIDADNFEHVASLFPILSGALRESILWYGLCLGVASPHAVGAYGEGIGLLVKREMTRKFTWLDKPICDISVSELEMLAAGKEGNLRRLRPMVSGALSVELFPGITASVRWPKSTDVDRLADSAQVGLEGEQQSLLGESIEDINPRMLLKKIEQSAMIIDEIRLEASRLFRQGGRRRRY